MSPKADEKPRVYIKKHRSKAFYFFISSFSVSLSLLLTLIFPVFNKPHEIDIISPLDSNLSMIALSPILNHELSIMATAFDDVSPCSLYLVWENGSVCYDDWKDYNISVGDEPYGKNWWSSNVGGITNHRGL